MPRFGGAFFIKKDLTTAQKNCIIIPLQTGHISISELLTNISFHRERAGSRSATMTESRKRASMYCIPILYITLTRRADLNNDGRTDVTDFEKIAAYLKGKTVL